MAQTPHRGKISQPRGSALGDGVTQEEIAPCRGRIIKRVVKVLPFQGENGVLPTQPRALPWAVWCWPCRPILCQPLHENVALYGQNQTRLLCLQLYRYRKKNPSP